MSRTKDKLARYDQIRQQVLQTRNTGEANMFDIENVKRLAYYYNCYDLINYLTIEQAGYANLVLIGKFNQSLSAESILGAFLVPIVYKIKSER